MIPDSEQGQQQGPEGQGRRAVQDPLGQAGGAIVAGAYFGDKLSPFSDTTNLAPVAARANLYDHIRHTLWTTTPAWLIGLGVLACVLLSGFTGYLLPWDQTAYWAITICTEMLALVPGIGPGLRAAVTGGGEIGSVYLADRVRFHDRRIAIPGWDTRHVNTLRLWSSKPHQTFDLSQFNEGNYLAAAHHEVLAETLSRVLYPDDSTPQGRELRLKQEYFFTSASLQDLVRRYLSTHDDLLSLPDHAAIQLNDTHPAIAVPELMRLLMDEHLLSWDNAWKITTQCMAYTNHTLLPEALERWPLDMFKKVLPRHLQIIEQIDRYFVSELKSKNLDIEPESVNARMALNDPEASLAIPSEADDARLGQGVVVLHEDQGGGEAADLLAGLEVDHVQ